MTSDKQQNEKPRGRWLRLTSLHTSEVVTVALAIFIAIVLVFIYRLGQGPISLSGMTTTVQYLMKGPLNATTMTMGHTELVWFKDSRALGLRIDGLTAIDDNNRTHLTAKGLEIGVSLPSIFAGATTLGHLKADALSTTLSMSPEGKIGLGYNVTGAPSDSGGLTELLLDMADPETQSPARFLYMVNIKNLRANFHEMDGPISWLATSPAIRFFRDDSGIGLDGEMNIQAPEVETATIAASIFSANDSPEALVYLNGQNIRPRALLPERMMVGQLHTIDMPLSLEAAIENEGLKRLKRADITLQAGAGAFVTKDTRQHISSGLIQTILNDNTQDIDVRGQVFGSQLDLGVQGQITPTFSDSGAFQSLSFDIRSADQVNLSSLSPSQIRFDRLAVLGDLSLTPLQLNLEKMDIGLAGGRLQTKGQVQAEKHEGQWFYSGAFSGDVSGGMQARSLLRLWPKGMFPNTFNFMNRAVRGGQIQQATFKLDLPGRVQKEKRLRDDDININFVVKNGAFQFMRNVDPIRNISARGIMTGHTLKMEMDKGTWAQSQLTDGHIWIPKFGDASKRLDLKVKVSGPAQPLMRALDGGNLKLAQRSKIKPENISGQVNVDFAMTRPLKKNATFNDLTLDYNLHFPQVTLRNAWREYNANGKNLVLSGDHTGFTISGPGQFGPVDGTVKFTNTFMGSYANRNIRIAGAVTASSLQDVGIDTYGLMSGTTETEIELDWLNRAPMRGTVNVNLENTKLGMGKDIWEKPTAAPGFATVEFQGSSTGGVDFKTIYVDAAGLRVNGQAQVAKDGRILDAAFPVMRVPNLADVSVMSSRKAAGSPLDIRITGSEVDGRGWLKSLIIGKREKRNRDMNFSVRLNRLKLTDADTLRAVEVTGKSQGQLQELTGYGELADGKTWDFKIQPQDGYRTITGQFANAGLAAQTLVGIENIKGGTGTLSGHWRYDGPMTLNVDARDIRVQKVPALATLLSVASIQGLGNALGGDGLRINRLVAPLVINKDVITVGEGRATGPGLGITGTGSIRTDSKTLNISGSLAPAYGLNSALGNIPVLGDILVSRKGEGIVAFTYALNGPIQSPRATVNPLSVLTPGVFRRIFEFGNTAPVAPDRPTAVPVPDPEDLPETGDMPAPTPIPNLENPVEDNEQSSDTEDANF